MHTIPNFSVAFASEQIYGFLGKCEKLKISVRDVEMPVACNYHRPSFIFSLSYNTLRSQPGMASPPGGGGGGRN